MMRILLADDDILVLNRLTEMLRRHPEKYEIAGQTTGGIACLNLLEAIPCDVLILDIDMPDKNGVDVSKEIFFKKLPVKILILSNYDTFAFVRDAMRYGAYDYLLKHQLTDDILFSKLDELAKLMEQEGMYTSHVTYFTTVARQQYFSALLKHGITSPEEHAHMVTQRDFSSGLHCLAVMQVTNFILVTHFSPAMDREKMIDSILNLATSIFATMDNGLITYLEYGSFAVLFHENAGENGKIWSQSVRSMRLLCDNIRRLLGLSVLFETGAPFSDFSLLPQICKNTLDTLGKKSFPPLDTVSKATLSFQDERSLTDALSSQDIRSLRHILENAFSHISTSSAFEFQRFLQELLELSSRFCQSFHPPIEMADFPRTDDFAKMSCDEVLHFFMTYLTALAERVPSPKNRQHSVHIQSAIEYIHENYARDLSLNDLAEQLHLSPTHLSRLFRKELDTSFIDYLVTYRIERARHMIRHSNLDLKTIGENVGFHGYNYFLRVYKEKTGHTPSQELGINENQS